MAPEQARGENVDHRADVYSLAAILYRAVTGHPAFTGKDVPTTLYDVVYRVPTAAVDARASCPATSIACSRSVSRRTRAIGSRPRSSSPTWFAAAITR